MLPSSHPEKVAARSKRMLWVLAGVAGLAMAGGSWLWVRYSAHPSVAPTAMKPSAPERPRPPDQPGVTPTAPVQAVAPVQPAMPVVPAATAMPAVETLSPGNSVPQEVAPKPTSPTPAAPIAARVEAPRPAADDATRAPAVAPARRAAPPSAIPPVSNPAPPVAAPVAAPRSEPPAEKASVSAFVDVDSAPPFDQSAAMQALREAGDAAKSCRSGDTPSGAVRVSVTFARSGRVAQANIEDAALASTPQGSCILGRFRAAQVPPFRGSSMTVRKTLSF